MLYAVIHENQLVSLHQNRDAAKAAALSAATGDKYVDFVYQVLPSETERYEVHYRPARNRSWIQSGYFIDSARDPS